MRDLLGHALLQAPDRDDEAERHHAGHREENDLRRQGEVVLDRREELLAR